MSAPFGNWENVLRNLLEKAKQASDLKDFQHFKDDYERIKYLQKNNVLKYDCLCEKCALKVLALVGIIFDKYIHS